MGRQTIGHLAVIVSNLVIITVLLLPLVALGISAIQTERSLLGFASGRSPREFTLSNFLVLFGLAEGEQTIAGAGQMPRAFANSVIVSVVTTVVALVLGALTAYSVIRVRWRGSRAYLYLILATRLVPEIVLIIPLFLALRRLGLLDSHVGLIAAEIGIFLPLSSWILTSYFANLPWEIEDAARIDGCSQLEAFVRVMVPMAAPGVAACSVIIFLLSWHLLIVPLVVSTGDNVATLPVLLVNFATDLNMRYSQLNAAAVIALIPTMVLVLLMRKYVVAGLTGGAIKG